MALKHENRGNGSGGGVANIKSETLEVHNEAEATTVNLNLVSSRRTISVDFDEGEKKFDINVSSEDGLRYVVKNFHEFMDAVQDIGTRRSGGETVSCVIQVVDTIDMTQPTEEDEQNYTVNGNPLIDRANKTYLFDWHLYYASIVCDGVRRTILTLFPDGSNNIDTWQIRVNRLRAMNVNLGGGISLYNQIHGTSYSPSHCNFSRFLFSSQVNLYYEFSQCVLPACSADDNGYNKFIYEGNGTHQDFQYHTYIKIIDCEFFYGGDAGNGYWSNLNAPIVIYSILTTGRSNQRNITFKQLTKYVNQSANETGCPHIEFRTVPQSDPSYDTIKSWWENHKWRVTSDGTAIVTTQIEDTLVLKTKLAVDDVWLQDETLTQDLPQDEKYVSLVSLLQNAGGVEIENDVNQLTSDDYLLGQRNGSLDNTHIKRFSGFDVASFLRKDIGLIDFYVYDSHYSDSDSRMILLSEVSSGNNLSKQLNGLIYYNVNNTGNVDGVLQKVYVSWNHGTYSVKTDLLSKHGNFRPVKPCIVRYSNKYYIALQQSGYSSSISFFGRQTLGLPAHTNSTLTTLYYDSQTEKWYSDMSRTSEVSVTFYANPERFPADNLDFGGTSSQAVAGNGTFLNWDSKLGYWTGTQQEYDDLPSEQKDLPNVLYIIN